MNIADLTALIDRLRSEPREAEWLEFKQNRYEPQELGEYLSALANAAGLIGKSRAYLIFGIKDGTHEIIGTDFDPTNTIAKGNQLLPLWLSLGLRPNVGFEIHVLDYQEKRLVIFEINPAFDKPVEFYGTAYIRVGTSKTNLANHPEKQRQLWLRRVDWSAEICEKASVADLDPEAIQKARKEFITKFPAKAEDVYAWDDLTFLNKAKLTVHGRITHAALLLLGNPEASTLLNPAVAKASWLLKNERNEDLDYEHFGPPFLLLGDRLMTRIRNLKVRELPGGTLFPIEMTQYDPWCIREALHNCIAHQDYLLGGRVQIVETPDSLLLTNCGGFLPGSVEAVIQQDAPLEIYRNPFLTEAMVNLNLIDTQGGGIKKMFIKQSGRFLPLPTYDLSNPERVIVRLIGRILDERYARVLMRHSDLNLNTIMLLDRVQKRLLITKEEHQHLKKLCLVEGRYPNLYVAAEIAAVTGDKARHIRDKGLSNQYYQTLILELIRTHQPVTRKDIDTMLLDKLPEVLNHEQKLTKISNILMQLSHKKKAIQNTGSRKQPKWNLTNQHQ